MFLRRRVGWFDVCNAGKQELSLYTLMWQGDGHSEISWRNCPESRCVPTKAGCELSTMHRGKRALKMYLWEGGFLLALLLILIRTLRINTKQSDSVWKQEKCYAAICGLLRNHTEHFCGSKLANTPSGDREGNHRHSLTEQVTRL